MVDRKWMAMANLVWVAVSGASVANFASSQLLFMLLSLGSLVFWYHQRVVGRFKKRLEKNESDSLVRTAELEEAYARLSAHLHEIPLAVIEWDRDFRVVLWTGQASAIFGWESREVLGRRPDEWHFIHPEDAGIVGPVMEELLQSGKRNVSHNRNYTADGRVIECEWFNSVRRTPEGELISIFSLVRDVSQRNQTQRELAALNEELEDRVRARTASLTESVNQFRGAFQAAAIGMALVSLDGRFAEVNDSLCDIVGYSREDLTRLTFQEITHPEDLELDLSLVRELTRGDIPHYHLDKRYFHKTGRIVWIRLSVSVVRDHQDAPLYYVAQIEDVTPAREATAALKNSLAEKELLLREVHHRVKNNLQIVTSLLQLQEGRISDPELSRPLRESRERVRAMSLVHESLYCSDDLAQVDMASYLRRLCEPLATERCRIGTRSSVRLPMTLAVPCGLVVNELVSNSLKHGGPEPRVEVVMEERDDRLHLEVRDSGPGIPEKVQEEETLGLRLVRALVGQLEGELTFLPPPEARVRISFPRAGD